MLVNLFPEEGLRVGHFSQASLSNNEEQNHQQRQTQSCSAGVAHPR